MHPQSSILDSLERERYLARERAALPERPASQAWGGLSWARVSTSVQDTIEEQQGQIQKLAKLHGVPVTRERYATGSRWNHKSEDWTALQADIASGQYSHLLLFKADRLAGDDQEMVGVVRDALRRGMTVLDTVVGRIDDNNAGFLGVMSHMEIKNTSVRVMLKLEGLPEEGVKVGSVPYGYQPQCRLHPCKCGLHGRHVPDPARKQYVIDLFADAARGERIETCRQRFQAASGRRCTDAGIRRMLRNQYYVGVVVGRKRRESVTMGRYGRPKEEWAVSRHEHPIIDQRTFDTVQARLDSQSTLGQHRTARPRHPLTGLVWCVRCERRMKLHRATEVSKSWQCPYCNVARGSKKVERAIIGLLQAIPFPNVAAAHDYAQQAQGQERLVKQQIKALDEQLDRLTARRSAWADLVADGDMSREDYRAKIAGNDRERAALRAEREQLVGRLAAAPGYEDVAREALASLVRLGNWTDALEGGSDEQRRGLYATLLQRVAIDADAGTLTLHYRPALAGWCGRPSDTVAL